MAEPDVSELIVGNPAERGVNVEAIKRLRGKYRDGTKGTTSDENRRQARSEPTGASRRDEASLGHAPHQHDLGPTMRVTDDRRPDSPSSMVVVGKERH